MKDEDVKVHFNVHFDPAKGTVVNSDIVEAITKEIEASNITGSVLDDIGINKDSLDIQGMFKKSVSGTWYPAAMHMVIFRFLYFFREVPINPTTPFKGISRSGIW